MEATRIGFVGGTVATGMSLLTAEKLLGCLFETVNTTLLNVDAVDALIFKTGIEDRIILDPVTIFANELGEETALLPLGVDVRYEDEVSAGTFE